MAVSNYSEMSSGLLLKDISSLMLHRINGGYHLDAIIRNSQLANRFKGVEGMYHKKNKRSANNSSVGLKVFWNWLHSITQLSSA